MSLLGEDSNPTELWTTAKKSDGTEIAFIKETTDMARWKQEEPPIFQAVYNALNAWIAQNPDANKKALSDWKSGGFTMIHDGMKYKVLQNKDGSMRVSKWKAGGSGGFGAKGGFQKSSYIHMKIDQIKMVRFEDAFDTINNQEENDNWSFIASFDRLEEKGGPIFVMVNSRPYTPKQESTTTRATPTQQSNPLLSESNNEENSEEES